MGVIYLLLLLVAVLLILVFTVVLRAAFSFDTDSGRVNLTLLWLYPFFKATVEGSPSGPLLKIFIFKGRVHERLLAPGAADKGNGGAKLFNSIKPENIQIHAEYGFSDPFLTGAACAAASTVSSYAGTASLSHSPDFASGRDYVRMDAAAGINVGNALIRLIRSKSNFNGRKEK